MKKVILFTSLFACVMHTNNGFSAVNNLIETEEGQIIHLEERRREAEERIVAEEEIYTFQKSDPKYSDIKVKNIYYIQEYTKNNQGERCSISEIIGTIKDLGEELEHELGEVNYKDLVRCMYYVANRMYYVTNCMCKVERDNKKPTLKCVYNSTREIYPFIELYFGTTHIIKDAYSIVCNIQKEECTEYTLNKIANIIRNLDERLNGEYHYEISEMLHGVQHRLSPLDVKILNISYDLKQLIRISKIVDFYVCNGIITITQYTKNNQGERCSIAEVINTIKTFGAELEGRFGRAYYRKLVDWMERVANNERNQTLDYIRNSVMEIYTSIHSDQKYSNIQVDDISRIQENTKNNQGERYSYTEILEAIKVKGQQVENTGRIVDYSRLAQTPYFYHNRCKSLQDTLNKIDVNNYSRVIEKKPGIITRVYNYISVSMTGIANSIADWWNGNTDSHKRSSSSQSDDAGSDSAPKSKRRK